MVAFSDILRKSSNASSHYPNVMYDKNAKKKPLPQKEKRLNYHAGAIVLFQINFELKFVKL